MDLLQELVWSLGNDGQRVFRKHLSTRSTGKEQKSLYVYNSLCDMEKKIPKQLVEELYDEENTQTLNAYRNIRLRLREQLENFMVQQTDKSDTAQQVAKHAVIARRLFMAQKHQAAWSYLKDAERLAIDAEEFELLNYVYQHMIEFAWTQPDSTLNDLIEKDHANQERVRILRSLSLAQSVIRNKLRELNAIGAIANIDEMTNDALEQFGVRDKVINNATFRYRIAMIVKLSLNEKKDYSTLTSYLIETLREMEENNLFDRYNQHYRLNLMTEVAVSSGFATDFETSLSYIGKIEGEIGQGSIGTEAEARLHVIKVCSFMYKNDCTTADRMMQAFRQQNDQLYRDNDYYFQRYNYNMASIQLTLGNVVGSRKFVNELLNQSKRVMSGFGMEGLFYCCVIECMLSVEVGDNDYAWSRIVSLERKFRDYLRQERNRRNLLFIRLLRKALKDPGVWQQTEFREEAFRFIQLREYGPGPEFISFNHWLYARLQNVPYNECITDLTDKA